MRRLAVLAVGGALLVGCGGSGGGAGPAGGGAGPAGGAAAAGHAAVTRSPVKKPAKRRARRPVKARGIAPAHASRALVGKIDASSDAVLAKALTQGAGSATVSAGARSDAEVRREIVEAERAGYALPSGNTASAFAASAAQASISNGEAFAVGAAIPATAWNPDRRPIAEWIVPVLAWAYAHGWTGTVTSGFRTYLQQAELNAAGAFSAPAGYSNHESTQYPGGAVDVTQPAELIRVLAGYPGLDKLNGGVLGPIDPEHFSATGA